MRPLRMREIAGAIPAGSTFKWGRRHPNQNLHPNKYLPGKVFCGTLLPEWLAIKPARNSEYGKVKDELEDLGLHTVCADAHCPNVTECWSCGTATFMVLGDTCTRGCRFCAVKKSAKGDEIDLA